MFFTVLILTFYGCLIEKGRDTFDSVDQEIPIIPGIRESGSSEGFPESGEETKYVNVSFLYIFDEKNLRGKAFFGIFDTFDRMITKLISADELTENSSSKGLGLERQEFVSRVSKVMSAHKGEALKGFIEQEKWDLLSFLHTSPTEQEFIRKEHRFRLLYGEYQRISDVQTRIKRRINEWNWLLNLIDKT